MSRQEKGTTVPPSDAAWRQKLTPLEYYVLREQGTEQPFTGTLLNENRPGTFHCRGCGAQLFDAGSKFDAHCGWPSFYDAKAGSVKFLQDNSHGMQRTEVRCANCDSHLGHVFADAPAQPTGQRYCMNSVALIFKPAAEVAHKN